MLLVSNGSYQKKKGSQQARNADMMMPSVRAAFRSLFILLLLAPAPGSAGSPLVLIPLICKCLFSSAVATLLLHTQYPADGRINIQHTPWLTVFSYSSYIPRCHDNTSIVFRFKKSALHVLILNKFTKYVKSSLSRR